MTVHFYLVIALSLMFFRPQKECMKARLVTQSWYSVINNKVGDVTEVKEAKLFIRNTSKKEIKVPQWLCDSYADGPDTDVNLEIMRKVENGTFVEAEKKNPDIDCVTLWRKFDTLKPGKKVEFGVQLDLIYELNKKGKYKVRAILLNRFTNCQEIATSWQEFEIR